MDNEPPVCPNCKYRHSANVDCDDDAAADGRTVSCAHCGNSVIEKDSWGDGDIGDDNSPSFCSEKCYKAGVSGEPDECEVCGYTGDFDYVHVDRAFICGDCGLATVKENA